MLKLYVMLALFPLLLGASRASAEEWKVDAIEGEAQVQRQNGWTALRVGDVIPRGAAIHTLAKGSLDLKRDDEWIYLAPETQIQIHDRTGQHYTTVDEKFGTVGVEARIENVRHFSIQTPFLTATVKGTVFGASTDAKVSVVSVRRGAVRVVDGANNIKADVVAGQSARAGKDQELMVSEIPTSGLGAFAAAAADAARLATPGALAPHASADLDKAKAADSAAAPPRPPGRPTSPISTRPPPRPAKPRLRGARSTSAISTRSPPWPAKPRFPAARSTSAISTRSPPWPAKPPFPEARSTSAASTRSPPWPAKPPFPAGKIDVSGLDKVAAAGGAGIAKGLAKRGEAERDKSDDDDDMTEDKKSEAQPATADPAPPRDVSAPSPEKRPEPPHRRKAAMEAPLLKLLFGIDAQYLWGVFLGLAILYFLIGKGLDLMLRDVAFGGALNGLIVLIGSLLGAWIRDRFFFGADWFPLEPYVSIEWIVGMGLFMFMAALVWRYLSFSDAGSPRTFKRSGPRSHSSSSAIARLQRR